MPNPVMNEFALIKRFFAPLSVATGSGNGLVLGIGDDAAVWQPPAGQQLVVCTDTLVAGRHFPAHTAAFSVGWKAVAVNLSDLAAMGAQPAAVLLALSMPDADADWLAGLAAGVDAACQPDQVRLIGGDTTRSPVLCLTVTALGWVPMGMAVRRDGAQTGDLIAVSGTLGGAAHALRHPGGALQHLLDRPQPRTALGQALRGLATAMIDVSDGLVQDLGHVLAASGVGAQLDLDAVPMPPLVQALPRHEALQRACAGGDDYELCFTVPPERWPEVAQRALALGVPVTAIGHIEAQSGLRLVQNGQPLAMDALDLKGFDHFG